MNNYIKLYKTIKPVFILLILNILMDGQQWTGKYIFKIK